MTLPNELHPGFLASAGGSGDLGDTIEQSLRFRHGNKLERNLQTQFGSFSSTATLSFWIKFTNRLTDSTSYSIWRCDNVGAAGADRGLTITRDSEIKVSATGNTSPTASTARLRDPNAWYHFMIIADSSEVKFYLNGENIFTNTSGWSSGTNAYSDTMRFQTLDEVANTIEYYLAEVNFLDGTKATVGTDFGRANGDGVWVPVAPSFTAAQYGTNGFRMTFDSSQSNGIGHDSAPIGGSGHTAARDFTATGFDTSSIVSYNDDVYGDTSTTYDNTNTNKVFLNSGQYGPSRMFDGDLVNDACKSGTGQAQTWIYWRPSGGLSISSSLVVHCSNTADVRINGTSTGQTNGGSLSDFPITIASPPSTLTELAIQGNSISSATIYGVVVDGVTLVNNTDTDVDYNDTPTSNYSTLNPLNTKVYSTTRISNANLRISGTATNAYIDAQSTQAASEFDCYCEATVIAQDLNGIGVGDITAAIASGAGSYVTYRENGAVIQYPGNTTLATVASYDTGDVLGMTATSTQVAFYKNGTLQGTYTHNLTGEFFAIGMAYNTGATSTMDFNFGQMPFLYTVPTGFKALQTNNLPNATIKDGKDHFEPVTWSGNDVDDRNITTTNGFAPDLVWIKSRSAGNHGLFDTIRGATKRIMSNYANAEDTQANDLQAFNTDGFQVGTQARVNASGQNYVAWCWKAGGTSVLNESGSINSQVSANTDAGFSIVSFTGTNAAATVGHGLNSAPEMIIFKNRDISSFWPVYHKDIVSSTGNYLALNVSDNNQPNSNIFNNTAPTSSVFSVGASSASNGSGNDMIAYCWHSVENFSKVGNYTGTANADGPFVYTGFEVQWLMVKCATNGGTDALSWQIIDTSRQSSNPNGKPLRPNSNVLEDNYTSAVVDLLSNGFKIRGTPDQYNKSGANYVYLAFASNPFGGENTAPATAR